MATFNLQCNSLSQIHSSVYFRLKVVMTGRAYIGEMLIQIWLKSMKLVYKQVNVQKESLKKLPGFTQNSRKPTKKCAMKMKETNKERKKTTGA